MINSDPIHSFLITTRFFIRLAPFSDYRIRRQLVFQAEYDVKCSILANPVSRSLLELNAKNHCNQIKEICQKGENSSTRLYYS